MGTDPGGPRKPVSGKLDAFGNKMIGSGPGPQRQLASQAARKSASVDLKRNAKRQKLEQKRDSGMMALLFDEATSDVQLQFDDGNILFAHRAILASRSPVLKSMLFGGMRESGQNTVKLAGVESAAMACLCSSIYIGEF